jgi:RHS repeat-associated protein
VDVVAATVTVEGVSGPEAQLEVSGGTLDVAGSVTTAEGLDVTSGTLTGAGNLEVFGLFSWTGGTLSGSGSTVLGRGSTGTIKEHFLHLSERLLVNEGTLTLPTGVLILEDGAAVLNEGTFKVNSEVDRAPITLGSGGPALIVNTGTFEKTEGTETVAVQVDFENYGVVRETTGHFVFPDFIEIPGETWGGEENPSAPYDEVAMCGEAVSCTGNLSPSQSDFAIGGRGVGLDLTRTYNSQAAAAGVHGVFGYGWSSSLSDHLVVEPSRHLATLVQADGSSVGFNEGAGGTFTGPAWTQDILSGTTGTGYTLRLEDQTVYKFAGASGRLESVTDRNGNATTLSYNGSGNLETITDPAGRTIKLAYNAEGLVESATDPMKHVVKYTYEGGNLATVTQPGETGLRWQFKYNEAHEMTEMIDGRGGKTVNKYNSAHQEIEQTDPMGRTTSFEYEPFETRTTNHSTGAVTVQFLTSSGLSAAVTRGYGTSSATTESSTYNTADELLSSTDGDGNTTKYTYENGNRTSMVDPEGHETKWTYDSAHDIHTTTTPDGEATTIERNSAGDPETVSRPAPGGTTQITKYGYDSHGDETSSEDPLKRVWKYEYDSAGDRTAEIDPEGDKRTWGYNEDSQETSMVSPRGHVSGAKEASYTTTTERDAQGRPVKVIAPLKHETTHKYDGDGNLESETDPEGHKTSYTYDADNERTKVEEPDGTSTESGYDGAGQVISQTDSEKHTTKYERNVLEQVTEVVDPLGRKTLKEYDKAGNLISVTDAEKRTTTYKYSPDNRLTEVSYSDGKTPDVKYEYNGDGDRTKMIDGTGTSTYEYDELDRLIAAKDGRGDTTGYEYDLANEQTKITYPNSKTVTPAYDNAGRLKSVTDWAEHTTKFKYNADSDLTATAFPTGTSDEDSYAYNEDDAMSEVKMTKGSETLASLVYTRNKDSEVTAATTKGLPGEEKPGFSYDESNRITKGAGIAYKYNEANNPTTIGSATYSYNAADELEKRTVSKATADTYSYNEVGERTKTEPASGPATTYGYDQAGNLTTVTRAEGSETPAIEDTYAYNGDGLRTSQTISGTTTYIAWDTAEQLPLILNDGTNSYIYGPSSLPVEQINNSTGTVLYLHHDQQGSTRLLTGSTGKTEATYTDDAYGNQTGHTGTSTTPMGYDGQYTNADTGLIYLRAREYDPATAQFLSVDPEVEQTREIYGYASDDPLMNGDPAGRSIFGDALEAAHYIISAGAIVGCAAQPEACAAAALFDVLLNSADTGIQAATNEKSVASALKEEVLTLVGGAVSFGSAKFWGKLTEWARVNKLLGTSASDIARNARLLNSGAAHWSVVQAAVSRLIQEKEGKCTRTN